jgi:hypothetical protein
MATRNRNLDKRMNFFERQFLRAQDLMDEQDYAQDRRLRLARSLYSPGVAEGLAVTAGPGAGTISVAAGTAVDGSGHIIVVLNPLTVNLRTDATAANLFISFSEAESDPSSDPGITGNTRIHEVAVITQQRTAPLPEPPPPGGVLLAAVALNNGQLTPPPAGGSNPDNTVRSHAGAVLGDDIAARSLRLRSDTVPLNQTPVLSCGNAGQLAVTGASVRVDPQQELLFQDNGQVRCFDDNHRIVFARSANRIDIREQGDVTINTGGSPAPERMRVAASGNVGIGTPSPAALLDVQGAGGQTKGLRLGSPAGQAFLFPGTAAPDTALLTFGDGTGNNKFHIGKASDNGASHFVTVQDNGRVGIGDDTPYANLTLNGTLGFNNGTAPMFFMFESGTTNPDRPIISHSPANVGWGLMYRDTTDQMIFQQNGNPVMTIDLALSRVGIGPAPPANPLQVTFANSAVSLPAAAIVIENPSGGQSQMSFSFAGVQKGSIRTDAIGNVVINAASGSLFLNTDFGGPPVLRPVGNLTVVGNLAVQGTLVAPTKSGCVVDQFVNRYGDVLEQGDVVVLSAKQSALYFGNDDIPIPEVDIASAAYDTKVASFPRKNPVESANPVPFEPATRHRRTHRCALRAGPEVATQTPTRPVYSHTRRRRMLLVPRGGPE